MKIQTYDAGNNVTEVEVPKWFRWTESDRHWVSDEVDYVRNLILWSLGNADPENEADLSGTVWVLSVAQIKAQKRAKLALDLSFLFFPR